MKMSQNTDTFKMDKKGAAAIGNSIDDAVIANTYDLNRDAIVKILNDSLVTQPVGVLRYNHRRCSAYGLASPVITEKFLVYANKERAHADRLANRDVQSRGDPEFLQETLLFRSHTDNDTLNDLMIMIRINMATERTAVKTYCQMIALAGNKDQNTRRPFENIVFNEEQHVYEPSD